jgi:outer membrane receptor protein involved in Fe transport
MRNRRLTALGVCLAAFGQTPSIEPVYTRVTVTAERGILREAGETTQFVSIAEPPAGLPVPTIGHALEGQPQVLVQSTTPGQVSPFLRGLTGYHVLNLMDGVRFNNSTFRSGPNQYLAYIAPATASVVETVLGPAGAQYGSDSLGGAVHVRTAPLSFADRLRPIGDVSAWAASADLSRGFDARAGMTAAKWAWLVGGSIAYHDDLRPGGGADSRDVFRRLFGATGVIGPRLPGTSWSRQGFHAKASAALTSRSLLTFWYSRGDLRGVDSYKDLLGGLGRLQSSFEPQVLDFGYVRFERPGRGALENLSATFSINSQRDGSIRQGQRFTDPVIRDRVEADAFGYSAQAVSRVTQRTVLVYGADIHDEHISAARTEDLRPVRALYPDDSVYRTYAGFGQGATELAGGRLRLSGGGRWTAIRFAAPGTEARPFDNFSWHTAAAWQVASEVAVHFLASRGFRAPNLNDLGAIGLNDLGYEIPASEAPGALVGASAGETATPVGRKTASLVPERLLNYEAGLRLRTGKFFARLQAFTASLEDPIDRRTLLFPVNAVPATLGGLSVTAIAPTAGQIASGVVPVATRFDPRAVKAFVNDGRFRYYGGEASAEYKLTNEWMLRGTGSMIHGRQLDPNRFVRRLPPSQGMASVLYARSGGRFWTEARTVFNTGQSRLSGGDLDDERIGASRTRRDIASFFTSPVAAPWVTNGVFMTTGETLAQIQERVLPGVAETARVPLYGSTAGWIRIDVLGGFRAGERTIVYAGIENLLDRNYRVHGSGIDGPGFNASVRVRYTF